MLYRETAIIKRQKSFQGYIQYDKWLKLHVIKLLRRNQEVT